MTKQMTPNNMIIGIDHEYDRQEFIEFNGKKIVSHDWIKPEHLDRRRGVLTLFNYDPFTGEKVNLSSIRKILNDTK